MSAMNNRLLRPRASGFNPKTVTGLYAWYDATDASTLTFNGSSVSQWRDKSGNGRNLVQSTALNQPGYVSSGINGKPAIAPDGVDDSLSLSASVSAYLPRYIVGAFRPISTNGGPWLKAGGLNDGVAFGQGASTLDSDGLNVVSLHETIAWRNSAIAMTQNAAVIASYQYQTAFFRTFPYGTADLSDVGFVSATNIFIGGYSTSSRYTDGYIGEVLIYTAVPSTSDRQKIERYLGSKWGVTVT